MKRALRHPAWCILLIAACSGTEPGNNVADDAAPAGDPGTFTRDLGQCADEPCMNGAQCSPTETGFECTCVEGFIGERCESDADDCAAAPCMNGGTCADEVASYTCACAAGYAGDNCENNVDDCTDGPCENGGTCVDGVAAFTCDCADGYSGNTCETNIDDCAETPCKNGGSCTDGVATFTCSCAAGYSGDTCETNVDDCDPVPCKNGGVCTDGINDFTCACAVGYTGEICTTNVDDCDPDPCKNGGTCADGVGSFTCACVAGYSGETCTTNVDECDPDPCQNEGICADGVDNFTCTCADGYSGDTCATDIDDCDPDPCQNSGTCADAVNGFECSCATGYSGDTCATNIDDCDPDPCQNDGLCTDGVNEFTCTCAAGYSGDVCATNIDDCDPNPCQNGGTCSDGVNEFTCACAPGYEGAACATNTDDCNPNPCGPGTACTDGLDTFTCGNLILAGDRVSCAVLSGQPKCWGMNTSGQLGQGDTNNRGDSTGPTELGIYSAQADMGTGRSAVKVLTDDYLSCALLDNGEVKCWGYGFEGRLGQGVNNHHGSRPDEMGDNLPAIDLGTGVTATDITMADSFVCALTDSADVKCWGYNADGQLGLGNTTIIGDEPNEMGDDLVAVDLDDNMVTQISAGDNFVCALLLNGPDIEVWCWGANDSGQLGLDHTETIGDDANEMGSNLVAVPSLSASPVVEIGCGNSHCCQRTDAGEVFCWGSNGYGELGREDFDNIGDDADPGIASASAVSLGVGRTATAISVGGFHTCAILDDFSVKCWGQNDAGQLGVGDSTNQGGQVGDMGDNLAAVPLAGSVSVISAGQSHACALIEGEAFCWGAGGSGRLGSGSTTNQGDDAGEVADLSAIALPDDVAAISAGGYASCAVDVNGDVYCWGVNAYGNLGIRNSMTVGDGPGTLGASTPFIDLGTGRTATGMSMRSSHACAVLDNGDTKCWGSGQVGIPDPPEIGTGPNQMGDNLAALALVEDSLAIAAGETFSCALSVTSKVRCWGEANLGELLAGNTTAQQDASEQSALALGGDVVEIALGESFACARLSDGTLKCWGANSVGQLAAGNTDNYGDDANEAASVPAVDLGTGRTAVRVVAGQNHACAILDNGTLKCWGDNAYGQLGLEDADTRGDGPGEMGDNLSAVDVGTGRTVKDVAAGTYHTCAILDDNSLRCWGANNSGQLGYEDETYRGYVPDTMGDALVAIDLGAELTADAVACGNEHTCVITSDDEVRCWGGNTSGQLGIHSVESRGSAANEMGPNLSSVPLTE